MAKYKKSKNADIPEDYESLLIKEEASLRQHIALENKLKLDYEIMTEKINSLETENNLLKNKIKEQKKIYESKIEEINKQLIDITNLKNDIQKNERKLRKKLDLKEKEIFQLQSKLNALNYNPGAYSNNIKIMKNVNYNTSFYGKEDTFKDFKKIKHNENISNNNISIINDIKKVNNNNNNNKEIENNELTSNRGRNNYTTSLNSNSVNHLNKYNSISKINNIPNFFEQDYLLENNNIDNETINSNYNKSNNIFNSIFQYNNNCNKGDNLSNIQKIKKDNILNENPNNKNNNIINEYKSNTLNQSGNKNIKDDKNIIKGNSNNMNSININNSIDLIKIDQKNNNNYRKICDNKLLLIAQNRSNNKLKRTFSAISNHDKNKINYNPINGVNQPNQNNKKEKLKLKRDITPDKLSNYNQNINDSILKISENSNNRILYLIKRTPKKNGYKNSMPNIKGINIYKNNNREINKFQFLSNKIASNNNLNNNYKGASYSHIKLNEYKKISPKNRICNEESSYNFNNTNIINNKIIQKEGDINNNIIIINGELVDPNSNKDDYPLISINKNNISLKRVTLKNTVTHELNKNK